MFQFYLKMDGIVYKLQSGSNILKVKLKNLLIVANLILGSNLIDIN